jgi:hypothetical protein
MNKMKAQMQKSKRKPQDMARMGKNSTLYVWILTCWQLAGSLLDNGAQRSNLKNARISDMFRKCFSRSSCGDCKVRTSTDQAADQVTDQVTEQVTEQVKCLHGCLNGFAVPEISVGTQE